MRARPSSFGLYIAGDPCDRKKMATDHEASPVRLADDGHRRLPVFGQALSRESSLGLGAELASDTRYRPLYVVWELTQACDHACAHCGSRSGRALPDELRTEEALDLVDQMAQLGVKEVTLIGGEAYLHEGFLQVARRIVERGMHCSVTTGGRAVDEALAQSMASAGVSTVSVSIDGTEAAHDQARRQRGSHARALRAVRALREAGLRPSVNSQIHRLSLPTLPALVDEMIREGVTRWMPIITVPMGRGADNAELLWQPYELVDVMQTLVAQVQRARAGGILVIPGNNVGYFGPHEHVLRDDFKGKYGGSCGAGRTTMGVEADGTIKSCPGLPTDSYAGGRIRDHDLESIWQRGEALRYTRERTVDDLWGFCRTCYYADVCMAGCTWTSHVILGRPGNNPYCVHRALTLRGEGKRERMVPSKAARGAPFDHGTYDLVVEDIPDSEGATP